MNHWWRKKTKKNKETR